MGGNLASGKTTWLASKIYIVRSPLTVPANASLVIEPGTVVKFAKGTALTVDKGATLSATGSKALPIVFTSIDDDANGGSVDGSDAVPNAGDWYQIGVSGSATFRHVHVFYNSEVENHGGIECYGGSIVFDDSEIAETLYECVNMHGGGTFTANNSIFRDSSLAFGYYGGSGVKVVNCVVAYCTTAVRQSNKRFYNTIFYNCKNFTDQGGNGSKFQYCCFYNPAGFGVQSNSGDVPSTCLWADPLFVDPDANDFHLTAKSPCIDAADGTIAPGRDYYGIGRTTVRTDGAPGRPAANGHYPDIGLNEYMPDNAESDYDLVPTVVASKTSVVRSGESLKLSWTVRNGGVVPVEGGWRDALYLVSAAGREVLLGENVTEKGLPVGGSVASTAEFVVPAMSEGKWYPKLVVNSRRSDVPEGTNAVNNVLVASTPVTVSIPTYPFADGCNGVLSGLGPTVLKFAFGGNAAGQIAHVKVPAGTTVSYGLGVLPQDEAAATPLTATERGDVLFHVPAGTGEVYVTLSEDVGAGEYEVSFEEGDVAVSYVTPDAIAGSGVTAITVIGAGFGKETVIRGVSSGREVVPIERKLISPEKMVVLFDGAQFAAGGTAELYVSELPQTRLRVNVLDSDARPELWARLVVPETVREGRLFSCAVEYGNSGTASATVPVFEVNVVGSGRLKYTNDAGAADYARLHFFGAGTAYPCDILPPGASGRVNFFLQASKDNRVTLSRGSIDEVSLRNGTQQPADPAAVREAIRRLGAIGTDATDYSVVCTVANEITAGTVRNMIGGMVVNRRQEPVAGARVAFAGAELDRAAAAVTDENGRFFVKGVSAGEYAVSVQGAVQLDAEQRVTVADEDLGNVVIAVDDELSFAVVASNLPSGESFEASAVAVGSAGVATAIVKSNEASFKGLDNGAYVVRCKASNGWIAETVVNLPALRGRTVEVTLAAPAAFVGNVPDADGNDLGSAVLFLPSGEVRPVLRQGGKIELSGLAPGECTLVSCSQGDDNPSFLTNVLLTAGQTRTITLAEQLTSGLELHEDVSEQISLSVSALTKAKALLEEYRRLSVSLRRSITERMSESVDNSCCVSYSYSYWRSEATSMVCQYESAILRLEQVITELETSLSIRMMSNRWAVYSASANRISATLRTLTIEEMLAIISSAAEQVVAFSESGAKPDEDGHAAIRAAYEKIELRKEDLADLPRAIMLFLSTEWTEGNVDLFRRTVSAISRGVNAYFELVECAKEILKVAVADSDIGKLADALVKSEEALGEKILVGIQSVGNTAAFVIGLETSESTETFVSRQVSLRESLQSCVESVTLMSESVRETAETVVVACGCGQCGADCPCHEKLEPMIEVEVVITVIVISWDPNEIVGPLGLGDARYVSPGEWMTYTVYFENLSNATASAAEVYVKTPLDKWLDWSTFEMGEVALNNQSDLGLVGMQRGECESAMKGTDYFVRSRVDLDETTGEVNWYLRAYDKTTADTWPTDLTAGILPPNDGTHCGEGHLTYRIKVREDAPRNAIIENRAEIVFDYNPMIPTNPNWWNTVGEIMSVTLNLGEGVTTNMALFVGEPFGELPTPPAREDYEFQGWFFGPNGTGGAVTAETPVPAGLTQIHAYWKRTRASLLSGLAEIDKDAFPATTYDGILYDAFGDVAGTIQVKAAKAKYNKKAYRTTSKLTISIQPVNETKKVLISGEYDLGLSGEQTFIEKRGRSVTLQLGSNGMTGLFEGCAVEAVANVFSAKDAESKVVAKEVESMWVGAINVVGDDVALAVSIAKKGKVKVSGTVNGAKVTATSQLLVGADACCVPVVITKKATLAFNLWLLDDGTVEIDGLEGAVVGKAGTLKSGATFAFGDTAAKGLAALPGLLDEYLPDGLAVVQSGTKWVVAPDEKGKAAKAGKVTFDKKTGAVDEAKLGENPSALKLTYTAKTGSFKGSFKAYTLVDSKVKAYTFSITGVMIGDTAYGTATLKKSAVSIPIVIE